MRKSYCNLIFCMLLGMLLSALSNQSLAQQTARVQLTGTVRGTGNQLLGGATVEVLSTTSLRSQTNDNGVYTLSLSSVSTTDSIRFSMVGYKTITRLINSRAVIDVVMEEDAKTIDEVVTVGYTTQRKVNLTGAVSSVGSKDIVKRPVMRASAALQGLAAGVTVTQSSGKPGADGGQIRIRGIGTLGDANPLVLVDGINSTLDGVDPNDIESISILKDAASASIYGSRAANGVILVTTKKGRSGKINLSYEGYTGQQRFIDLPDMVDGYTFMTKHNESRANLGTSPLYNDQFLADYLANKTTDPDNYPDNNWQKLLYTGSGVIQRHHISVNGGDKIKIMSSFSYQNQEGLVPGFSSKAYAFRLNTLSQINDKLKLETFMYGRHSPITSAVLGDDVVGAANRIPAIYTARLSDGRWGIAKDGYNTLAFLEEGGEFNEYYNSLRLTAQLTYSPVKNLDIEVGYTPSFSDYSQKNFRKSIKTYLPGQVAPAFTTPALASLSQAESQGWENTSRLLVKYAKNIGDHRFRMLGGFEQIEYNQRRISAYREGFDFPNLDELNAGAQVNWSNSGTSTAWSLQSYFGRLNYSFRDKYLVEANFRADGSSRFAKGNRFGYFPSVSLGWVVSNESFMQNIGWISSLKLRGSWGKLGNQNIGDNFPFASYLSLTGRYIFNGVPVSSAIQTDLANAAISWESSTSKNLGFDIDLFRKLSASFDVYSRITSGILLKLDIPAITGLNAPYQNAGVVKNTGWDLSLNYRNSVGDFDYSIGGNLSNVKNTVVDLKGTGPYINGYQLIEEGFAINSLFGYRSASIYQNNKEVTDGPVQFGVVSPGDIRYVDMTGDTVVNANDRAVIGNPVPRMTFGLTLSGSYKGFDLSVFVQGVGKRDVILTNEAAWALYNNNNMQAWQLDYWTPQNPGAKYPRLISASTHNNFQFSDFWVYNAGYARIKNLQIGYTLPASVLNKLKVTKLRVYATADNLFTFHKMPPGWDPERPNGDSSPYPLSRTYIFGVSLTL